MGREAFPLALLCVSEPMSVDHMGESASIMARDKFAIVTSRYNAFVTGRLAEAARATLIAQGIAAGAIQMVEVPGAWELPLAVAAAARSGRFRAIIACGAVIRGETAHYEHVARACLDGLGQVQRDARLPIALAVLTTDTVEQALERAGGKAGNKGEEAALAALETADVLDRLIAKR